MSPKTMVVVTQDLLNRAAKEPIGVDISDYSDEFCEGFLRGQVTVLEELVREVQDRANDEQPPVQRIDITIWPNDPRTPRVRAHAHRTDDGSDEPEEMI